MEKYKATLLVFGLVILQIILAGEGLYASRPSVHENTIAGSAESALPYSVKLPEKSLPQKEPPFLDKIIIVSSSYNIPDDNSKLISYDENIYLFAVVKDARGNHYLGDDDSLPPRLKIGNKK
ncbi:MAG: hypothetical protein JSW13_00695, partial [Candidatus Aerophobus sp.]